MCLVSALVIKQSTNVSVLNASSLSKHWHLSQLKFLYKAAREFFAYLAYSAVHNRCRLLSCRQFSVAVTYSSKRAQQLFTLWIRTFCCSLYRHFLLMYEKISNFTIQSIYICEALSIWFEAAGWWKLKIFYMTYSHRAMFE